MIAEAQESTALEACRQSLVSQLEEGSFTLPVLPQVAGQVLSLTSDPNADLGDLSDLIHRDQSLAGHVLRVANSAAYGGDIAIVSLQQAVTRLGMKLLAETAIAVSVHREVFRVKGFEAELKLIWRHALAAGTYGKEVARSKRHNVEGQFLCSLLATVGQPVVLQGIAHWQQKHHLELSPASVAILLDHLHTRIGQRVTEQWKLPQSVQTCCAFYRQYTKAPSFQKEATMTYLSTRLAAWLIQTEPLNETAIRADQAFGHLNFYPDDIQELLDKQEVVLSMVQAISA
jgi:HD-like signal output (HDOD) protein